jgi:hypothetical protein
MEHMMKTTLLLSTLAAGLITAATPLFAQAAFGPPYPYPQGYQELGDFRSAHSQFGPSDYGYYQGRVNTGRHQASRARNHASTKVQEGAGEIR